MSEWIYTTSPDNTTRYSLGERGANNLICIGVNPSTASPEKLDKTAIGVKRIAEKSGYDGWLMINLYAQRDTYPKNIHEEGVKQLMEQNIQEISTIIHNGDYHYIWAAWGISIEERPFLLDCLKEMYKEIGKQFQWIHYGDLTKAGHPKHPSRMSYSETFSKFEIDKYLSM